MCTPSSLKEERCPSTWRAWELETWLTSEDQEVCWSTRAKVWCMFPSYLTWCLYLHSDHTWHLHLHPTGQFAIQADKKTAAEIKVARTLGLIAGGTGTVVSYLVPLKIKPFCVCLITHNHTNQWIFSMCRHYANVAAHSWHHEEPRWHDYMQLAVCQPGWCPIRKIWRDCLYGCNCDNFLKGQFAQK